MVTMARIYLRVFILNFLFVFSENSAQSRTACSGKRRCGDCISSSPLCSWCSDPTVTKDRCALRENITKTCKKEYIHSVNQSIEIENNIPEDHSSSSSNPIRMSPRSVKLKMRPNEYMNFLLTFVMSKNYPIDIYFLFDASHTMINYTSIVANIIDELVKEITNLTTSYKIGFGSFVDKESLPYMMVLGDRNKMMCKQPCVPGFSFKNYMNLSSNLTLIKESLGHVSIAGNMDQREGGFDAIVQAVVCKEIIGWRKYSRKMVILFTDEVSHTAGDGKLGGIIEPNTLQCHLDESGRYTWSTKEDYPSIAQLSSVLEENRINMIFAVSPNCMGWYERACQAIPGCSVGLLSPDPYIVTKLMTDNYFKIQSSIQLSVNASNDIHVLISSNCSSNDRSTRNTSACFGVKVGEEVTFEISTSSKSCGKQEFNIVPIGVEENFKVEMEIICSCACKNDESNSSHCHGQGDLTCGLCRCLPGYHGYKCQCSGDAQRDEQLCKSPKTSEICSGRGYCNCGKCYCDALNVGDPQKKYSGQFCECDDYSCDGMDDNMCSGNGVCKCGQCHCFIGYSGEICDCTTNVTNCTSSTNKICNDKGTCVCGSCHCTIDSRYKGDTCEDCPTCPGMCDQMSECVSCHLDSKDTSLCSNYCASKSVTIVTSVSESNLSSDESYCKVVGEDNCYVMFKINYNKKIINVQKTKECIKINYFLIIGSAVGGILVAGFMLLLVWKVVVTVYDQREYRAFEKEKENATWIENLNPLYREVVCKYDNPTFKPSIQKTSF